jgi:hypothetical protein
MLLLQGMSSPRHAASSSGPSLNGDGTGGGSSDGEFSPKRIFERRKRNIPNNNGDVEDGLEECSKKTRVKGIRGGVITSSLRSTGSTITSVLQMGKRLWQSPNRRAEMMHIIKNNRRIVLLILIAIPFILRPSRLWKWSYLYFGRHNIHGGAYGRLVEYLVNKWTWQETQRQQQMQLQQLGVVLPTMYNNGKFIPHLIQTQAALRELLVRRQVRGNTLVALERNANAVARADHSTNSNDGCQDEDGRSPRGRFLIPRVLFVPDVITWNPPRPGKVKAFQKLLFDDQEMKLLVADTAPFPTPLVDQWWDASGILHRIQLFALCAINHFGGVFLSEEDGLSSIQEEDNSNIVTDMLYSSTGWFEEATSTTSTATKTIHKTMYNPHGGGGGSFGIVVLGNNSTINTIAATPRHPFLYCALRNLEQSIAQYAYSSIDAASIIISSFSSLYAIQETPTIGWTRLWSTCQSHNKNSAADYCTDINSESFTSDLKFSDLLAAESKGPAAVAELWFLQLPSPKAIAPSLPAKPITVTIRQESSGQQLQHGTGKATKKVSLDSRLQSLGLQPSWLCARCIRVPTYGTMDKCSKFCPSKGYTDFVCHSPDVPEVVQVPLNIIVQGAGGSGPLASSRSSRSTMIPRIIHQTWFEDIDLDRYPQLARLRNGWKNTGWQYRLYTDTTARKYIADYFPALFVEAFDVLVPGAYKADLFRYLVLLREGGTVISVLTLLQGSVESLSSLSLSHPHAFSLLLGQASTLISMSCSKRHSTHF